MRLLIVEDNEELAELLAKGLRTAGYEADVLSTVEDARAVLGTTFYAALILDLGLPDGDGLALLRELRQRDNPIPVLVLTARGGLHDRVQRPAQRRRRLPGETVRAGGIDRAARSAVASSRASCSAIRCRSPISNSTRRTGKPRSTISRRCSRPARPRCWNC